MDPSTSDESAGQTRGGWRREAGAVDVSLALADPPPSMTAAHWANRDNETLYRRPGATGTPRRPPAENSFPEDTGVMPMARAPQLAPADGSGYPYPDAGRPDAGGQSGTDQRSRHWTTAGTDTRRPSTGDRGGAASPGLPPAPISPARANPSAAGPPSAGPLPAAPPLSGLPLTGLPLTGLPLAGLPLAGPPLDGPALGGPGPGNAALGGSALGGSALGGPPMTAAQARPGPQAPAGPAGRPTPSGDAPGYAYGSGRPVSGRPASGRPPVGGPPSGEPASARARTGAQRDDEIGVLGGPGRDIRPHRANAGAGPGREKPPTDAGAPRRRSRGRLAVVLLVSVVTLAGLGTAATAVVTGEPAGLASALGTDDTGTDDARTVTAPLQGRTESALEIVTGTTQVVLRSEDLGDDLYRITTPDDSDSRPRPVIDGDRVQLQLTPGTDGSASGVEVVLSSKVRWALRFAGGSDTERVDMSQGRVASVDIAGGARRFELTLPPASGTVGVRLAGAVDEFVVTAPKDNPVRVQAGSGAKTVAAGARTLRDVKPGSTITPKGWDVANRYDIDAAAKVSLLSITNRD